MSQYDLYIYEGPVLEFDKLITERWRGETYAISEKKAKSNLIYRFKKENNKSPNARITLPGKIEII